MQDSAKCSLRRFIDPYTRRIFAGCTYGLYMFIIRRVSLNCNSVPLGPIAFKLAEREVLSASFCFVKTYRCQVLNPDILPLTEGGILPIQDTLGAYNDPDTKFLCSRTGFFFDPYEVLFIYKELWPFESGA